MSSLFGSKRKKRQLPTEPPTSTPSTASSSTPQINPKQILPGGHTFRSLGITSPPLLSSLSSLSYKTPTPIQRRVIPSILSNPHSNILALAPTGSGKTATFVLPILQTLLEDPYGIYCVIVSPTRELAAQIRDQVLALSGGSNGGIRCALVTGGLDIHEQSRQLLKKPHFVVATPGRLGELIRESHRGNSAVALKHVRYVVLDEADRLLSEIGFERDVAEVLLATTNSGNTRKKAQILLFSATMGKDLTVFQKFGDENDDGGDGCGSGTGKLLRYSVEDEDEVGEDGEAISTPKIPPGLKQEYMFVPSKVRDTYLVTLLQQLMHPQTNTSSRDSSSSSYSGTNHHEPSTGVCQSAILFVSTCARATILQQTLLALHYSTTSLHGMISQDRRTASLHKFKSHLVPILIATDVASRGLDIPNVDLVVNVDMPRNAEDYIHRVGRTARNGVRGKSVSIVTEGDVGLVHAAEELAGRKMEKCGEVTEEMAVRNLGIVTKAMRVAKMQVMEYGLEDLIKERGERRKTERLEKRRVREYAEKQVSRSVRSDGRKVDTGKGKKRGKSRSGKKERNTKRAKKEERQVAYAFQKEKKQQSKDKKIIPLK